MRKFSASDIALNVIRFGLIAAIAVTIIMSFVSNGTTTTISASDVSSAPPPYSGYSGSGTSKAAEEKAGSQININTATAEQLTALDGIGESKANAIIQYREQHGDFASIEDLLNVPGIGEKILEGIRPYVTVGSAAVSQNEVTTAERTAAEPVQSGKININTATAEQLTTLDGIGESKANAIIQYREQHGDFKSIDDLLNVPGIGEKILEGIRPYVTVGSAAVSQNEVMTAERTAAEPVQSGKVNINTATAEQLTTLDGIGESKANAIIQYREQHGDFKSPDDLLNVPGIGEKILEGIRPYITVGSAAVSQNEVTTAERTAAEPVQSGKVNINTATAEQLTALDGIGESKANAIIQYREQHGDFKSLDDLLNVKGIGEKTLSNIRQDITL